VLSSLFIGPTAALVDDVLAAVVGTVAVIGAPKLARALSERGRSVIAVADVPRSLKRLRGAGISAAAQSLPVGDGALAAAVGVGAGALDQWEELVREWSRAVVEGGCVVMIDRGPAAELSRRALCAGLMDIRQRSAGRVIATSGWVAKLPG